MERKLTAILHADVAGYSRLMREDEEATLRTLTVYREELVTIMRQHRGRLVGTAGDGFLAEFASVVDAVQCAVVIQATLKAENASLLANRRMQFRIGINLGDVMVEGEQIYGDGVNIAARLEALAEPGGICISGTVHEHIKNKLSLSYEDLGAQQVKNIAEPVRVYRLVLEVPSPLVGEGQGEGVAGSGKVVTTPHPNLPPQGGKEPKGLVQEKRRMSTTHLSWAAVVAGLILLLGGLGTVWYLSSPSIRNPQSEIRNQAEPALPLPDKPSIVVLPFDNMSGDPQQEYFSDGITEVLTSDLSRISSLFVIARNTAFTYKGKAINVQEIGKELGVRYALEGSVQRAGDQVRIVVQLVDTTTDAHLWSERFDRPLKDIFALQDEIVQKIVTTLKLQFTLRERGVIVRKRTDNLEAYDAFLRGREYYERLTKAAHAQARQLFEKATELDPQYAEAYAWLGWTYLIEWLWRWSADPKTLEHALTLAQQALALDDSLPWAHTVLSFVYAQKQQYDQAVAEGERAIALDPNNADSYSAQANVLIAAGRPQEALQLVERAMRLNPHYPAVYLFNLGVAYRATGRYTEAIAALKEAINRNPNLIAHSILALSYLLQWTDQLSQDPQTLAQALAAVQQAIALNDSFPLSHVTLGYVYLWQKQYEPAIAEMERAIAVAPNRADSYAGLAEVLSRVGRPEEALGLAAQALRLGFPPHGVDSYLESLGAVYYLAGRTEEAIAPLKEFRARFPNRLAVHLTLAAVYSELGREAEARAEAAEVLRLNPNFSLEVHRQRIPIKDPAVLERHIVALRKAGLK